MFNTFLLFATNDNESIGIKELFEQYEPPKPERPAFQAPKKVLGKDLKPIFDLATTQPEDPSIAKFFSIMLGLVPEKPTKVPFKKGDVVVIDLDYTLIVPKAYEADLVPYQSFRDEYPENFAVPRKTIALRELIKQAKEAGVIILGFSDTPLDPTEHAFVRKKIEHRNALFNELGVQFTQQEELPTGFNPANVNNGLGFERLLTLSAQEKATKTQTPIEFHNGIIYTDPQNKGKGKIAVINSLIDEFSRVNYFIDRLFFFDDSAHIPKSVDPYDQLKPFYVFPDQEYYECIRRINAPLLKGNYEVEWVFKE